MHGILPSLIWGLISYTFYGVAMVLMKLGEPALAAPKKIFSDVGVRRSAIYWLIGVTCNFSFAVTLGIALGLGHASVLAALNGFGLVVVAILSRWILDEHLSATGWSGVGLVIVGVILIGLFAAPPSVAAELVASTATPFFLIITVACIIAGIVTWRRPGLGGPLLGGAAGALGGAAMLFQKVFVDPMMAEGLEGLALFWVMVSSLFFWGWSLAATASFVVLQVAFRFGEASRITPLMVSTMILIPQAGGVVLFAEELAAGQLLGTILILIGVTLITATAPARASTEPLAR